MEGNQMDLTADHIFYDIPTNNDTQLTIELIPHEIENLEYKNVISKLYFLIKDATDTRSQLLFWEVRLLLLLFNDQLSAAKREAIALNNVLYFGDSQQSQPPSTPSSSYQGTPIYPLPKNNNLLIPYSLILLLLRLKSTPTLGLLHELYKLIYQSRLKLASDKETLQIRLTNLSYQVIAVLNINKNYPTLLNHLNNVREHLMKYKNDEQYLSNINLLLIIVEAQTMFAKTNSTKTITSKYERVFEEVNLLSKNSVVYVLQNIQPMIGKYSKPSTSEITDLDSLATLLNIIETGGITGRIICALLGLWELSNTYLFDLVSDDDGIHFANTLSTTGGSIPEDQHDKLYNLVTSQWCKYIHKVYGLE